ncbi:MAG TPA: ABC transporter permease, partial [Acidimicrobiales bacterium]|nr:ABC transporter permease [Acidimicrobiales bacterium]
MLPFVVSGLVVGSIYAIAAMGLVLTYRTTGLLNFAHGGIAMATAYAFYQLRVEWSVPSALAVPLCIFVFAPLLGVLIDRVLFRVLDGASQASKVVATIGLLVLLRGLAELVFGDHPRPVEPFLSQRTLRVLGVNITVEQFVIVAVAVVALVGLTLFLRRVRLGVAMRAVVDDRTLVASAGFPAERVTMATWALGCVLAGTAGVLIAPAVGVDTVTLTLLVIQSFAPAVLGRLFSLPVTFAGALGLGVLSSVLLKAIQGNQTLVLGLRPSLSFLLLFGVLAFAPRGWLRELGVSKPWQGTVRTRTGFGWLPVGVACAVLALTLSRPAVFTLGIAIVLACTFLAATMLTGTTGLLNLCPAALAGTGAFMYIHATRDWGLPFWVGFLVSGLAVVPFGLAIGLPALRLPSLFLALATFGFGLVVDGLVFTWVPFTGGTSALSQGLRPSLFTSDRGYVLLLVPILVAFMLSVGLVRRLALGRTLVALRDSPAAAATVGINVLWPRLAVFVISAFMSGVAGALYAGLLQTASTTYFSFTTSLVWVAVVVIGGVERPLGAVMGGFLLAFAPYWLSSHAELAKYLTPAFGLGAILLARRPGGLVGLIADSMPRRLIAVREPPVETELDMAVDVA